MDVAVTELRAHLGRWIDAAREGNDVVITESTGSAGFNGTTTRIVALRLPESSHSTRLRSSTA